MQYFENVSDKSTIVSNETSKFKYAFFLNLVLLGISVSNSKCSRQTQNVQNICYSQNSPHIQKTVFNFKRYLLLHT